MRILYYILAAVLVASGCIMGGILFKKKRVLKYKNDIQKLFTSACMEKNIQDYRIEYVKKDTHDFYFEDAENIYYIKVIYNFSNQEICINNAIKWQLRRLGEIKGTLSFVEGVEPLMRLDLANTQKKEHKLFIIYPNVTALLKVINECEMVFVYPDTDVYGAQVISYKKLEENLDLLEV